MVELAWSKHLAATSNTSIGNSRELQCPSWQEPVKHYILAKKAFPLYQSGNWSTRRFQLIFLNVEALNQMSKSICRHVKNHLSLFKVFHAPTVATWIIASWPTSASITINIPIKLRIIIFIRVPNWTTPFFKLIPRLPMPFPPDKTEKKLVK